MMSEINDDGVAAVWAGAVRGVDYELIDHSDGNGVQVVVLSDTAPQIDMVAVRSASSAADLQRLKEQKIEQLNTACAGYIVGGFESSALGTAHFYDSALEDQLNLAGVAALGVDLPYRCRDSAGVKDFLPHTAAQLKQVAADGVQFKLGALVRVQLLKQQVIAAVDAAGVEAVKW